MRQHLKSRSALLGLCVLAACAAVQAQAPSALVEDVHGKVEGIEFMDYVAPGRVIRLAPGDTLVLGYLRSCWRETISGGTVTVGEEHSTVALGKVQRAKVLCTPARAPLGARDATQSAATVFRSMRRDLAAPVAAPALPTVHGRSPVVEVMDQRGRLVLQRLDVAEERIEVAVAGPALVGERFFDLARAGIALQPGASYAASLGALKLEFRVAAQALPGQTPVIGRLLRLE